MKVTLSKKDDVPVTPFRSALMASVRQQHSGPELVVREILRELGLKYSLHRKSLPGRPDICLPAKRSVVFVHGCFWHRHKGCRKSTTPKTRSDFWTDKFMKNVRRDARNTAALRKMGWSVYVVWECRCKDRDRLRRRLARCFTQPPPNIS
jgi:DNA mismatch endonuclease (patch repair protein)